MVFARNPLPGRVKTRLIPSLGAAVATHIYRRLLHDTLAAASHCVADTRELWLDAAPAIDEMQHLATTHHLSLHTQQGQDIGQRMHHALSSSPGERRYTVLVGSDCADLDTAHLDQAFAALEQCDVVLGPAADGGYVLIGLAESNKALFEGIEWGTDRVLSQTRQQLARLQLTWRELAVRRDVDRIDDVMRMPHLAAIARRAGNIDR